MGTKVVLPMKIVLACGQPSSTFDSSMTFADNTDAFCRTLCVGTIRGYTNNVRTYEPIKSPPVMAELRETRAKQSVAL